MATVNQQLSDEMIAHALFVSRYSVGTARKMVAVLNQSDVELSTRLMMALDALDVDQNTFTVSYLQSMLSSVRVVNKQAVSAMLAALDLELNAFAGSEAAYQMDLFGALLPDVVQHHFPLAAIAQEQVYAAAMAQPFQGRLLRDWASTIEDDRLARITNAVRYGYMEGQTVDQIVRTVRGTKAKNYMDGALQTGRANATAVVRTAIGHVSAVARNKFAANNADVAKGKIWRSTLDNKTSAQCRIRDSLKYTLKGQPIGHRVPYLQGPGRIHFCCRSTETLITKSWRELGIDIDEMDPGTRASMDGQVPADTTYGEWLQRQSYYRQTQVLGATRAKLMRDGGLAYDKFYSDTGEWLTLEQLRKIDASAFEEAGV